MTPVEWSPALGLSFAELYTRDGLVRLDAIFCGWLNQEDVSLYARLMAGRHSPGALAVKNESELLIDLAPSVEAFLARLFGVSQEVDRLVMRQRDLSPLYAAKRLFVQRRAAKAIAPETAATFDGEMLEAELSVMFDETVSEIAVARHVMAWLEQPEKHAAALDLAQRYAAWALYHPAGQQKHEGGVLFRLPKKIDPLHLLHLETQEVDGVRMLQSPQSQLRYRNGFALTDPRGSLVQALDEANYCIYCHHQGKDSCAKGLREKDGAFKTSALGVALAGCPLEEKISEMNQLKAQAVPLGSLAVAMIDNPMLAGTGHRICNDCMKACIYQKQEPVNIPLLETRVLDDVLALPYGFEIYSLLTRWNPLNLHRPLPRMPTGRTVLVAGLGPAGYTLAHHLMNDGHTVVGIDGLKIEPLDPSLNGVAADGARVPFYPIKEVEAVKEPLENRTLAGFGGVAEYGITVRWDKNYLKMIRLLLERREECALVGGVRFGGTLTKRSAFALGFDHIALCMGAGRPTMLDIPGGLSRGVRAASDFLMALQLTGAAKEDSIANLQIRLPVVVIGGGLTAIDTATEALAYYPLQVEKFLSRYEAMAAEKSEAALRAAYSEEENIIADEFLAHARAIRLERASALQQTRAPDILSLLREWGGATLAYRKRLVDAPSYRLNHEEVEKALEEGIRFAEALEPVEIAEDAFGHAIHIVFRRDGTDTVTMPARTVLIAAGTSPNTVLAREDGSITLDGQYFQAVDESGCPVTPERSVKPDEVRVLMATGAFGKSMSFFGDLHPSFAGNVVKAMASAKQGYPVVSNVLAGQPAHAQSKSNGDFLRDLRHALSAKVIAVKRLAPTIVEIILHAPLAAAQFKPGQFFRLQNFEANALFGNGTRFAMEGLALTGAWADRENGVVSCIVLEMGGSSDLCKFLLPGEPVTLMGPTGTPTDIPKNETVLLAGGGLGNAVLFSIGKAMRENGCRVLYFAGYRTLQDRYKIEEIEAAADIIVWCCDEAPGFAPSRTQDFAFVGNIVEAIEAYGKGGLESWIAEEKSRPSIPRFSDSLIPLSSVERIIAIGSDRMMAAVAAARHGRLKAYLDPRHVAIGSINSPMQCMMKEICAQCLQQQIDPETGQTHYIFSCYNQDQLLDEVCFSNLSQRLRQNSVQEKLAAKWLAFSSHQDGNAGAHRP